MHDGTTLIVDVEQIGGKYGLSQPAEDLWVAYEVVRRHIDADGVRHYSQMTDAKMTADGYEFVFDTGDVFTCSSHLLKPSSDTCSDTSASSSPIMEAGTKVKTLYATVLGDFLEGVEVRMFMTTSLINGYELPGLTGVLEEYDKCLLNGVELESVQMFAGVSDGKIYLSLDDATASGKSFRLVNQKTNYPASCINLWDDENEDLPSYATVVDGVAYTLDETYDASPHYERLRRGLPVWARFMIDGQETFSLIDKWSTTDDSVGLGMEHTADGISIYTENYRPVASEGGTDPYDETISPTNPGLPEYGS